MVANREIMVNKFGVKSIIKWILRPLLYLRHYYRIRKLAYKTQNHYVEVIEDIKGSGRTVLNFAAYIVYDSSYGIDTIFKYMKEHRDRWNPMVVIVPDISRGQEHARRIYDTTKTFFLNKYGNEYVLDGWDVERNEYIDYLERFDIVYYNNPYDLMVHEYHKIKYASTKNVLPIYIPYGYYATKKFLSDYARREEFNLFWRIFAETSFSYNCLKKVQIIHGENAVLAGYPKMDELAAYPIRFNKKKKILISPHHTVLDKGLRMSNFLDYYDLIRRLPDLFPEAEFVFRPHPLLFTTLINNEIWSNKEVDEFVDEIQKKGMVYSKGGDYLSLFAECDAIVNDCGSFTTEWLLTGKPGCFMLNKNFNIGKPDELMYKAIHQYTIARNESDIINFINKIIETESSKEYKMESWVEKEVAINYPNASNAVLKHLDILNN